MLRRAACFSVALGVLVALGSCANRSSDANLAYEDDRASRMFAAGFQDVADIYIEDVSVASLALAGIENLSSIDPSIEILRRGKQITVSVNGREAGAFEAAAEQDADGWADITAATIGTGRRHSVQLARSGAEDVYEAVFDGVTAELDSFSRYAGREEARENRASRDGFGGIGVRISLIDEGVKVLSVMENTPAENAGLLDGDVIVQIDGTPVKGLTQREVVRRLRGPLRSSVTLTVDRKGERAPQVISVTRAHIVPQTVKYNAEGNIGYIRVSGFNQSTARTLRKKVRQAQEELGVRLEGFILDLRNNPGGLLDQSVSVSDLFLANGRIVSTHGRHPDSHQYFDAKSGTLTDEHPVVVLINGHSASASEIVAAALQDAGRAVVVGSTSFGKGTVQTVLRLPNEGELTLTWARFHAPTGYGLNGRGVVPDICTSEGFETPDEVLKGLRSGLFPIDKAIRNRDIAPNDTAAIDALREHCPLFDGDNELDKEVAKRLLADPVLYARALNGVPDTARRGADQVSRLHSLPTAALAAPLPGQATGSAFSPGAHP
ncbi:MAG: S41 family peptidase [Kiloniellales bacterium]|nr:S41 family peptidase [Kiloniellales bacterium]